MAAAAAAAARLDSGEDTPSLRAAYARSVAAEGDVCEPRSRAQTTRK